MLYFQNMLYYTSQFFNFDENFKDIQFWTTELDSKVCFLKYCFIGLA